MRTTSLDHHQFNAADVARWLVVTALIGCLLGLDTAPAHARYGYSIRSGISSGDSGWVFGDHDTVPTLTRRVHPGNGVTFEIKGVASGNPTIPPDPVVKGCSAAGGISPRYVLARNGGEDITKAVTGHGWTEDHGDDRWWKVVVRLAVRVGSHVPPGASMSCRVTVNGDPVRANLEVV